MLCETVIRWRSAFPKRFGDLPHHDTYQRLAEGVGFEPTVRLPARLISSQVPSTTQPPFQPLPLKDLQPLADRPLQHLIPTSDTAGRKHQPTGAWSEPTSPTVGPSADAAALVYFARIRIGGKLIRDSSFANRSESPSLALPESSRLASRQSGDVAPSLFKGASQLSQS